MHKDTTLITWPAILHYPGQDELDYIASEQAFASVVQLLACGIQTAHRLIDSTGRIFIWSSPENKLENRLLQSVAESATLQQVIELVRTCGPIRLVLRCQDIGAIHRRRDSIGRYDLIRNPVREYRNNLSLNPTPQ